MDEEKTSRQVRRQLERAGELKTAEQQAEDARIAAMVEKYKAEHAAQQEREQAQIAKGKRNIYTCEQCFGHVVTADCAEGVTPFLIKCRATPDCGGMMQSSMYRVFDQRMRADFEWYKPTKEETIKLNADTREHVNKGGLILRPSPKGLVPEGGRMREAMNWQALKCRHGCSDPVVGIYYAREGCWCFPDHLQALCEQHAVKGLQNNDMCAVLERPRP